MADKSELQHMPRPVDELVLSEARSSLIARGSNDAKTIMARKPEPALRARVKMNGKWGLIDKIGRFVIEPFCYEIRSFSCGMAAFSDVPVRRSQRLYQRGKDDLGGRLCKPLPIQRWASADRSAWGYYEAGHWGFVDKSLRVVIPPRFKWVRNFSEDLAGVASDGKWGFVSKDGRFVIEPRFDATEDFSEGICLVTFHGKDGFIDTSGIFRVQPRFKYLWAFCEGLACAEIDNKYCFVDKTGEIVIPPVFDSAEDFHGGVARAELNGKSCLIDPKGSTIFICADENEGGDHLSKEKLGDFCDGLALVSGCYLAPLSDCSHSHPGCNGVCTDDPCSCPHDSLVCEKCSSNYGYYIDRTGKPLQMPDGTVGIEDFSEGTALVETPQGERRLIDKSGNFVDALNKEAADSRNGDVVVKEGLVSIEVNGLYGFEDEMGRVVIEPKFAWLDYFSNGMARFNTSRHRDGKWGFIDRTGKTVIPPQFDDAQDFEILSP